MFWSTIANLLAVISFLPPVLVKLWKAIEVPAQTAEHSIALPGTYPDASDDHLDNEDEINDMDLIIQLCQQASLEPLLWASLWHIVIPILVLYSDVAIYVHKELFYYGVAAIRWAYNLNEITQASPGVEVVNFSLEDFGLQASTSTQLHQIPQQSFNEEDILRLPAWLHASWDQSST